MVSPSSFISFLSLFFIIYQDEDEFQAISKRMAKFKRPLDVILPKFKALARRTAENRLKLDQLGLTELIENDNY